MPALFVILALLMLAGCEGSKGAGKYKTDWAPMFGGFIVIILGTVLGYYIVKGLK